MSKKLSTEEFIEKARSIHGIRYDYSKVDYVNNRTKVCIICPEHGKIWQRPNDHLNGCGCNLCGIISRSNKKRNGKEFFVKKAKETHGDKYDYSKVEYVNNRTKVCIICPEHGEFWQTPYQHTHGDGCPSCAKVKPLSTEEFIQRAQEIHGTKYDYSKTIYKNSNTKVCIICPEHGDF